MSISVRITIPDADPDLDLRGLSAYLTAALEESTGAPVDIQLVDKDSINLLEQMGVRPRANNV